MATDDLVRTQIRLPSELHKRLVDSADQAGRSVNAEMVFRLESTYPASLEVQLITARRDDLARLDAENQAINSQIADLNIQLSQPSKKKIRGQIQEAIASLGRRQLAIRSLRLTTEIEIEKLLKLAQAEAGEQAES
ncbi:Arc family DNA-binding protein [Stenotrophomonas sp.]|uniref:Arc family DNA-binding protein n=1 Tax=Stenotrophomonas sp. TaxID=69392 RepID=UPI0028A96B83|nr:Arc family DNA-binding protein [Stenotrophomonas sp.]